LVRPVCDRGLCFHYPEVIHKPVVIIQTVLNPAKHQLSAIAHAANRLGFDFCLRQCGQQQRRENRDDGNHHQKLDQRKGTASIWLGTDSISTCFVGTIIVLFHGIGEIELKLNEYVVNGKFFYLHDFGLL